MLISEMHRQHSLRRAAFMMHHLGGDGKSLVYFIETFMKCLAGWECEYAPFRHLGLSDIPKDSKMPLSGAAIYGTSGTFTEGFAESGSCGVL